MPRTKKEKSDIIDTFAQRLSDLILDKAEIGGRDENGHKVYSLEKIAEQTSISKGALSKWQRGRIKELPRIDYLRRLADFFGVTVEWLAGTPGAVKDQNTTLAQTGLTASALESLISAEKKYPGLASDVISSKNFIELLYTFNYLKNMADLLESLIDDDGSIIDADTISLSDFSETFRYQRYAVMEVSLSLLDELVHDTQLLKRAEKALDGFHFNQFEDNEYVDLE